ncbi:MAG: type II toxin-antitoxin system RelE/ParE family toxin [Chloroflexi bacterium]|nr:type II toxin-antitoxin system RelE/ParE family toxin [Chloroflexota bacterium]
MKPAIIQWTTEANHELRRLDPALADRVCKAIERFARSGQGDVAKVKTVDDGFRLRVGKCRIVFELQTRDPNDIMTILNVLPRDKAYK